MLKLSYLKTGSSPLYFLPGQEDQLLRFTSHLNEKDQQTVTLLQDKKILKDSDQSPLVRVSLREIKDFAQPLQVEHNGSSDIFWKWFLISQEEAEEKIRRIITPQKHKEILKKEPQQKLKQPEKQLPAKKVIEKTKETTKPFIDKTIPDDFLKEIYAYFEKKHICVISHTIIKKKSEIDFVLEMPSAVGTLTYYCKAKNKKRVSETDLSHAFVQGQFQKLPVLFLHLGKLTKKAEEYVSTQLKGITVKSMN